MRTPLTYYGGKQRLAAQIVPLFPPHDVYLEPFAGGAAVLFAKPPAKRETLNDLDGEVQRFWRALRERPIELVEAVAATPYSRVEWQMSSDVDGVEDGVEDDVEAARRFLVNIDQSFGRSRGSYAVPSLGRGRNQWQPATWANLPEKLLAAAQRLRGVALEHGDALDLIPKWDRAGTVIYIDPPYTGPHRRDPSIKYAFDTDVDLWSRLAACLADVRHASVFVSGYPCVEMEDIGWIMVNLDATRPTADAEKAPEVLWCNCR